MNIDQIKAAVDAARDRRALVDGNRPTNCPLCGSKPKIKYHSAAGLEGPYVGCDWCYVQSDFYEQMQGGEKSAIKCWNRRPDQEQSDAALIALWDLVPVKMLVGQGSQPYMEDSSEV